MSTRIPAGVLLAFFLFSTTGCGQKGPLTIPRDTPPQAGQEQPEAAEEDKDSEEQPNE